MKNIVSIVLLFVSLSLFAQGGKSFHNKELGWSIQLPEDYTPMSDEEAKEAKKEGVDMIEDTYDVDLESSLVNVKTLFVLKKDDQNYFEANIQSFNPETDGDYEQICKDAGDLISEAFKAQFPEADIKAFYSKEKIGKREFAKNTVIIAIPGVFSFNTISYSSLIGNKNLTVNLTYVDEAEGKKMLDAFKNSTFK